MEIQNTEPSKTFNSHQIFPADRQGICRDIFYVTAHNFGNESSTYIFCRKVHKMPVKLTNCAFINRHWFSFTLDIDFSRGLYLVL